MRDFFLPFIFVQIFTIDNRFTLGKRERLKSRKLIEKLFREGGSFSQVPLRILYTFPSSAGAPLQAGFAVSARNFKKAVDRNRIKRLMREAWRINNIDLKNKLTAGKKYMAVFLVYTGSEIPEYKLMADKMITVLNRLNKIADENISANT